MSLLFSSVKFRSVELANRIVMSPMCMYSANEGLATDWHRVHLGARAIGGVGLIVAEATAISPAARITPGDLGLWSDAHVAALKPVTAFIESVGSVPAVQLAHAGRKAGRTVPWEGNAPIPTATWGPLLAPSAIPFQPGWNTPLAMSRAAIEQVVSDFSAATKRAYEAGFKVVEAHFAHGYLLHQFLSPLSNHRNDEFGGPLESRARFPLMVIKAMRKAWPDELPLFVRLSIIDWAQGGLTLEETIRFVSWLKQDGVDLVDCSSGAVVPDETIPVAPGYHGPMTKDIRTRTGMATGVVGGIIAPQMADAMVADGTADLVFLARALLKDPYWARFAAESLGAANALEIPTQYRRAVASMTMKGQR